MQLLFGVFLFIKTNEKKKLDGHMFYICYGHQFYTGFYMVNFLFYSLEFVTKVSSAIFFFYFLLTHSTSFWRWFLGQILQAKPKLFHSLFHSLFCSVLFSVRSFSIDLIGSTSEICLYFSFISKIACNAWRIPNSKIYINRTN